MDNFHDQYQKTIKIAAITMLLASILWFFMPKAETAGLAFGLCIGIVNSYLLYRHVNLTTDRLEPGAGLRVKVPLDISSFRLLIVIIALLFAYKIEGISIYTSLLGFLYCHMLAYFRLLASLLRENL